MLDLEQYVLEAARDWSNDQQHLSAVAGDAGIHRAGQIQSTLLPWETWIRVDMDQGRHGH